MGMRSCYMEAEKALLDELRTKSSEEVFEAVEELEEEDCEIYDMDKMWDGLHFLITGVSATTPIDNHLLSEAIVGTGMFVEEEESDFISYIYPERVKEIYGALEELDIKEKLDEFSPKDFAENGIYPTIWMREDKEELKEELAEAYEGLQKFFGLMVEKEMGMIVSIY